MWEFFRLGVLVSLTLFYLLFFPYGFQIIMMPPPRPAAGVEVFILTVLFAFRYDQFGYISPLYESFYLFELEVAYGIVDGILDAIFPSRTASKADPVSAPSVPEVTNDTGSIACVTQAKTFQDVS